MYHELNEDPIMLGVAFMNPSTAPEKEDRV